MYVFIYYLLLLFVCSCHKLGGTTTWQQVACSCFIANEFKRPSILILLDIIMYECVYVWVCVCVVDLSSSLGL